MWQCPKCESMNEGERCEACGADKPAQLQIHDCGAAQAGYEEPFETNQPPKMEPSPEEGEPQREPRPQQRRDAPRGGRTGLAITVVVCVTVIVAMVLAAGTYIYVTNRKGTTQAQSTSVVTASPTPEGKTSGAESVLPSDEPGTSVPATSATPKQTQQPDPAPSAATDAGLADKTAKRDNFLSRAQAIEQYSATYFETAASQADLNHESGIVFQKWDELLNDVYQYLKTTLSPDEFSKLQQEEIAWVKEKEAAMESTGALWEGGSGQVMAENSVGIEYTSKRCYYLITLIQ